MASVLEWWVSSKLAARKLLESVWSCGDDLARIAIALFVGVRPEAQLPFATWRGGGGCPWNGFFLFFFFVFEGGVLKHLLLVVMVVVASIAPLLTVESFSISSSEAPSEANPISCENWAKLGSASSGM